MISISNSDAATMARCLKFAATALSGSRNTRTADKARLMRLLAAKLDNKAKQDEGKGN